MTTLSDLISPLNKDEFMQKHLGNNPLHVSGNREKFKFLFHWENIESILNSGRFDDILVQLVPDQIER